MYNVHCTYHKFKILFACVNIVIPGLNDVIIVDDLGFVFVALHELSHAHEVDFGSGLYSCQGQQSHCYA